VHTILDRILAALSKCGITPTCDGGAEPASFEELADALESHVAGHEAGGDGDGDALNPADSPPVLMSLTPYSKEKDIVKRQEQLAARYSSPPRAGGRPRKRS
jgi:hypothetical protein